MKVDQTGVAEGFIREMVPWSQARRRAGFVPPVKVILTGPSDRVRCTVCSREMVIGRAFDKSRLDESTEFTAGHYEMCFPMFETVADPKYQRAVATV